MTFNSHLIPATSNRVKRAHDLRVHLATIDNAVAIPPQADNGDEARYPDKSGTYTKGLKQDRLGVVNHAAYDSFIKALKSGDPADFEKIITGGNRTQNGPQGGLAFHLNMVDSHQINVRAAPSLDSEEYAAELIELYWASLLRDVSFVDYSTNAVAMRAAAELNGLADYKGPGHGGRVTTENLFRGTFSGEDKGPYVSQFLLKQGTFGALAFDQRYRTNAAHKDFVLDSNEFMDVQNGMPTGKSLTPAGPLYLHDGRGLAAYTHEDVLYEAYFVAYLLLDKLGGSFLNPGNPYRSSKTQNGFASFGGPDVSAALATVAGLAIKAVWYQKWWVHLRHRPESGGGIVHLLKTGQGGTINGHVSNTVLISQAVAACYAANNSYLLSQAFPEGSPTHPAYPTGHGAVAGACITILKFFFDGTKVIPDPKVSADGTALTNYLGVDATKLTINGELHKLASNISFGHGVHGGIHWRSDTLTSIQFGEAVAISYLEDLSKCYNEKFSISLTKLDGTPKTFTHQTGAAD